MSGRRQRTVLLREDTIFNGDTILIPGLDFKGRRLGMEFPREEVGMMFWHFQGRWSCLTLCSEPGGLQVSRREECNNSLAG